MIVEDDKECLEELREMLASAGYDVKAVNDSVLALEGANKAKPDCILLDLKMPNKSGFQVADELRHISEVAHIPIIAMSAYLKDDYTSLLNICGIKKCLRKPFHPLDVIGQIEEVLSERRK